MPLGNRELAEEGTVLLVEDEAFVREVACEVLRSRGYRVLTATNANEAADIFRERGSEIDLLLTDMILPGETGLELAERLRGNNPELKVLLATGYQEQMARLSQWQKECLAKPFSSEELLRRVREVLRAPTLQGQIASGVPAGARGLQDLARNLA